MHQFAREELTFDVRDGGPSDGEVVVLLHGFPEDGGSYDAVVPALHEAGYRTLVPDQRGYSPQARPRGRWRYRLADLVADVIALLDQAGVLQAHLVGHDWGAAVAWEMARRHPDRVLTLTALSVPHLQAMAWAWRHSRQARRSSYVALFQIPVVVEYGLAARLERTLIRSGLRPDYAAHYGQRFSTPSSLSGPLNWYRALPWAVFDGEGRRIAAVVTVPTTYIWGRRDPFIDRAAASRSERYVEADYRFVELDANHWLPENYAAEIVPLILDRLSARPRDAEPPQ
ncbi:MAG TPA: alpha/beta fold hydrolase [Dermatophilaceae bacterium]|nr:alpha/beta fold hydrolase [Dermatophilaceae bacterium]